MTRKGKIAGDIVIQLSEIKDHRRSWGNKRHELVDILFIALCAIVCGLQDFEGIVIFAEERIEWLRKYVELKNGIPSVSTFERVFQAMSPEAMRKFYQSWTDHMRTEATKQIGLDGKSVRGASAIQKVHIVSAWAHEDGLCLGQIRVDEKSNEITAIPELLELLDIKGSVVSIDAMGCQREIAQKIIEGGGEYILAVKDNQPTLASEIEECFEWIEQEKPVEIEVDRWISPYEKDHGRIEHREVKIIDCPAWPGVREAWCGLATLVEYKCSREIIGDKTNGKTWSKRYYISSKRCSAEEMARYLRNHWSIENNLHWTLDVTFGEDASQVRMFNAPENLNVLRKVAMTLLRNVPTQENQASKAK